MYKWSSYLEVSQNSGNSDCLNPHKIETAWLLLQKMKQIVSKVSGE